MVTLTETDDAVEHETREEVQDCFIKSIIVIRDFREARSGRGSTRSKKGFLSVLDSVEFSQSDASSSSSIAHSSIVLFDLGGSLSIASSLWIVCCTI